SAAHLQSCCAALASPQPACGSVVAVLGRMIAFNRSLSYVKRAWKVPGHGGGPAAGSLRRCLHQARPRRLMSCLSSRVLPARQVPTSPRREASLFHLPDLAVRHFLWRHRRGTRRPPPAGSAVGWINKEIDQDRVLSASSDATGGRGVVHAYPDQGSPPRDGIGGGRAG